MKVRVLASLREFDTLAPAWNELLEESGQTSPMASHDWYAASWRTAGPDRRRELWLVEDCAGPVAMIPLVRSRTRLRGLTVRRLEFLGGQHAPFVDVPFVGNASLVLNAFLDACGERRDWDLLVLDRMLAQSSFYKALAVTVPDRFLWRQAEVVESPYLTIAGSWEQFHAGLPAAVRETMATVEDGLRRRGEVAVEVHHQVDPKGRAFHDAVDVANISWRRGRDILATSLQGVPRLFRELVQRGSLSLSLWIARVDGRPVAAEYQVGSHGATHTLGVDDDAELAGTYLNAAIVRSLFEQGGARHYHMGVSDTGRRLTWGSDAHECLGLQLSPQNLYGRLIHRMAAGRCA